MSARRPLVVALCLALSSWGLVCSDEDIVLEITSPAAGGRVEACHVEILVEVGGSADPATLVATLNGAPLALDETSAGSGIFAATVSEGPPLQPDNTLLVEVASGAGAASRSVAFGYASPELLARRINDPADLITGPRASSRLGDYLLQNCRARFIIQDAPQRDLTGIAQYGGNLIDAELRSRPGLDSFFEIQPILNIESVLHATRVVVVDDGRDGGPAVIRSCGPDDVLDYVNANTLVDDLLGPGAFPALANDVDLPLEACTEYALAAGDSHVEIVTTVENLGSEDVSLYVGDWVNGGGEVEQWTSEISGTNPFGLTSGIGEMATNFGFGVLSLFGFGAAVGVDYGYIPESFTPPPPFSVSASSSFSQGGLNAILHSTQIVPVLFLGFPPTFLVPAGGSNSYRRLLSVGDGSGANAIDLLLALQGVATGTLGGCVTVGGVPAPGARVAVGIQVGNRLEELTSHWVADAEGCYEGNLPPGTYAVAAGRLGTPYEGGGPAPVFHTVVIPDGGTVLQDLALPATGRVQVSVVDELGRPVPARINVVGEDPSPEILNTFSLAGAIDISSSLFHDATKDPLPEGISWVAYAGASGSAAFDLEPGTYDVVVTRGTEYSSHTETVTVSAAPAPPTRVNAQIAHVLDTLGFVSSDFHVHMLPSFDSNVALDKRVTAFAGEGVDNIVATDHDRHTDLMPTIASEGLTDFVHATVGEEITTFDYGHYNAYPMAIDPDRISGGSTDWGIPAPPGLGFPSQGAFSATPEQIFDLVFDTERLAGGLLNTSPETVVQINHIAGDAFGHFDLLKIDTSRTPPSSQLTDAEKEARRLCSRAVEGSCDDAGDVFFAYPALELWNGYTREHQLVEFLEQRLGIWANHLNQGLLTTAIYDTDTHEFFNTRSGGARSWTPASSDAPAAIDDEEVAAAVKAGKVVGGQGVYVQTRVRSAGQKKASLKKSKKASKKAIKKLSKKKFSKKTIGFGLNDRTMLRAKKGMVTLDIEVQAPTWAEYDRIEIYRNASTTVTGCNGSTPVLFTAHPAEVLVKDVHFTVDTVDVFPGIPGARRFETSISVDYALAEDTWLAVIVRGTEGVSRTMFPEMPASLGQGGVHALGATNALYVDVDENAKVWDPPGVRCTNCATFCAP